MYIVESLRVDVFGKLYWDKVSTHKYWIMAVNAFMFHKGNPRIRRNK